MNLYVGNISPAVNPAELQQIFSGMGEVLYAKLSDGKAKNSDKGYAFVYVPDEERARAALASLNGKLLKGEALTVSQMSEHPGIVGAPKK